MSKSDAQSGKKEKNNTIRWIITVFIVTILISGAISFLSDEIMSVSSVLVAFVILLVIVLLGIIFDVVGVAVTSADEKPFHSMAARKVPGSLESLHLLRKAERVSSICNDVVGDICGVVSGSASATIAVQVLQDVSDLNWQKIISLAMSALVAGLTVGGKAIGKTVAIKSCIPIVHMVGRFISAIHRIGRIFHKEK